MVRRIRCQSLLGVKGLRKVEQFLHVLLGQIGNVLAFENFNSSG